MPCNIADNIVGHFYSVKKLAKVTKEATANIRLVAFFVKLLHKENSKISHAILSGCYVVGGPNRDIFRWIKTIWFFGTTIYGKAPDDIDLSVDPSQFAF